MKLVIFDVDGTLIDTRSATWEASCRAYEELRGEPLPKKEMSHLFSMPSFESGRIMGFENPGDFEEAVIRHYNEISPTTTFLFDGLHTVLDKLSNRGIQLGIATSRLEREIPPDFSRLGLDSYHWLLSTPDLCPAPKPDGRVLTRLLDLAGVDSKDALYIGDLPIDFECAKNARVLFAQAAWSADAPIIEGVKTILRQPEDIEAFFPNQDSSRE